MVALVALILLQQDFWDALRKFYHIPVPVSRHFIFCGKLYFRMAFRKLFVNGQCEETEGFKREKEV